MPAWRRSTPSTDERHGVNRRRFLRAAGVGTAGAVVAAGVVGGQAGAAPEGLAVPIPPRRKVLRATPQGTQGAEAIQVVSGPLSLHTISPQRYLDTREDTGGAFPPQGSTGQAFIFDFGLPDYFGGGVTNEVPPNALAVTFNVTVTGGTSGGNLRAFPATSPGQRREQLHRGGVPQRLDQGQRPRDRGHLRLLHLTDPRRRPAPLSLRRPRRTRPRPRPPAGRAPARGRAATGRAAAPWCPRPRARH